MESLYPPEDGKARPVTRIPTSSPHRHSADPPRPCDPQSSHDYINLQAPTTSRKYENVQPILQDPVVQQAREHYMAEVEAAAAAKEVKESMYENVPM